MSLHKINLRWKRNTPDFKYETYDRTHEITAEGGITFKASSAPEFVGKKEYINPEEGLAAALASCHMLTFLAIAAKSRLIVESYDDTSIATLDKNSDGKLCITKITLNPKVVFSSDTAVDSEKLKSLHDKAHHNCFIANSIKCTVEINSL